MCDKVLIFVQYVVEQCEFSYCDDEYDFSYPGSVLSVCGETMIIFPCVGNP